MRTHSVVGALVVLPVALAACSRQPQPQPVMVPVMSGPEQACANQAATLTGIDPALVSVTPVSATKAGATVYAVDAGGTSYSCVVELDGTVSSFAAG